MNSTLQGDFTIS